MPAGTHENKAFTANWQTVTYTVTYTLGGGVNAEENPDTFTVESDTFILAIPTRGGYTFTGWTFAGQTEPQLVATVPTGTHENLTFVANWQANTYTVTYLLNEGVATGNNPTSYTPESEAFTLSAPSRVGHTFMGWTFAGQTEPQTDVTVPTGSYGDKTFAANWQANTYTVTFDANEGTVSPTSMTVTYGEAYTLPIPTREGYAFDGWYKGNTKTTDGIWRTAGGKALTARWSVAPYTITYVLNGGVNAPSNPTSFSASSAAITLASPTREGYTFSGWTWAGQTTPVLSVTIPSGTTESKTFYANWEVQTVVTTELWKDITDLADVDGDFVPVLRFAVTSDIHTRFIGEGDPDGTTTDEVAASTRRTEGLFRYSYEYAAKSAYPNVDAVMVVGDYTDRGMTQQYDAFTNIINAEMQEGTQLLIALGNHEFWNTNESGGSSTTTTNTYARFEQYFGHAPDSHVVIGGYHFIGLSPDCNGGRNYSETKAAWLAEQLQIAAADDPTGLKPIFVYEHISPANSVYGSSSTTNASANYAAITTGNVMNDYPQVVLFAGHSHRPVTDPASVMQTNYTVLNTGSLTYGSMEFYTDSGTVGGLPLGLEGDWYGNMTDTWYEHGEKEQSAYILVEVDANNRIRVQYIDADTGYLLQEIILIDSVGKKDEFTLTSARGDASEIPYFENTATVTLTEVYPTAAVLTFTQGVCRDKIRDYKVELYQNDSLVQTIYRLSNIYFSNAPSTLTAPFTGLQPSTSYDIKIYAYNTWGKISTVPLLGSFTTAGAEGETTPDIFSLAFREDGTPYDAVSGEDLVKNGTPTTAADPTLGQTVGVFNSNGDYQWHGLVDNYELMRHGFTFEAYARIDAIPEGTYYDVTSAQQSGGFGFELKSNGKLQFFVFSKSSRSYAAPGANVPTGEYVHIVGVCNGTDVYLYFNGVQVATGTLSGGEVFFPVKNSACYLSIGADASTDYRSTNSFTGRIAAVNIYTTPLSAAQVAALYDAL